MYTVIDLLRDQGIEKGIEKGIEQGFEKGIVKGIEKGRQEGRMEDVEKLLLKRVLSPEEIASVLEVDRAWVEEIAGRVLRNK
jgi:flagellar biosynthesis/type III secretory pathway protein FliH